MNAKRAAMPSLLAAAAVIVVTAGCSNEVRTPIVVHPLPPLVIERDLADANKSAPPAPQPAAPVTATAGASTSAIAPPSQPIVRPEPPAQTQLPSRNDVPATTAPDASPTDRPITTAPTPAKPVKPAAPAVAERPPARPAAQPPKPAPTATLNVEDLKNRLKDTAAIGLFTKLALKNQMDDLLKQFQTYHRDGKKAVTALRQPFDMLVLKVLAVLQDGDPDLAKAISSSREAIWNILADPVKFNSLT